MGPLICQKQIRSAVESKGLSTKELANRAFWYQNWEKAIYLCRVYMKGTVEETQVTQVTKTSQTIRTSA